MCYLILYTIVLIVSLFFLKNESTNLNILPHTPLSNSNGIVITYFGNIKTCCYLLCVTCLHNIFEWNEILAIKENI